MFERLRNLIVAFGAIFALLPSLVIGLGLVAMPPEIESRLTYIAAVVGMVVFFGVIVARPVLLKLKRRFQIAMFGGAVLAGLFCAGWLFELADESIRYYVDATVNREDPVRVPFVLPARSHYSPELKTLIDEKYRGRIDAFIKDDPGNAIEMLSQDSKPVQRTILVVFLFAHGLLTFGLMLGGFAAVKAAGGPTHVPRDDAGGAG